MPPPGPRGQFWQPGSYPPAEMSQPMGALSPTIIWTKVDVLTAYQRLTAEIQIRGRLRETMNDPEPLFHLRNVSAEPLMPGAVQLNGVPEGTFNKTAVCGIRTIEAEAPLPDQPAQPGPQDREQQPEGIDRFRRRRRACRCRGRCGGDRGSRAVSGGRPSG